MNKYQEAIKRVELDFEDRVEEDNILMVGRMDIEALQRLVDKATPMKPIQLEEGKYSCPSCAMAFKLKTLVKDMFVNNQYCDVLWSKARLE